MKNYWNWHICHEHQAPIVCSQDWRLFDSVSVREVRKITRVLRVRLQKLLTKSLCLLSSQNRHIWHLGFQKVTLYFWKLLSKMPNIAIRSTISSLFFFLSESCQKKATFVQNVVLLFGSFLLTRLCQTFICSSDSTRPLEEEIGKCGHQFFQISRLKK